MHEYMYNCHVCFNKIYSKAALYNSKVWVYRWSNLETQLSFADFSQGKVTNYIKSIFRKLNLSILLKKQLVLQGMLTISEALC